MEPLFLSSVGVCVGLSRLISMSHNLFQLNSLCREKEIPQSVMRCCGTRLSLF